MNIVEIQFRPPDVDMVLRAEEFVTEVKAGRYDSFVVVARERGGKSWISIRSPTVNAIEEAGILLLNALRRLGVPTAELDKEPPAA